MAEGICVICETRTDDAMPLCSTDCRREAIGRRAANEAILRRLPHARRATKLRREIMSQQGYLTSAILRYDSRQRG